MKKILLFSLGAFLALSSCTKTDGLTPTLEGEVTFTSSIASAATRVTDTEFEEGDAISVFASSGSSYVAENVKYESVNGVFTSTSPIVSDGSAMTFAAVYPYASDLALSGTITVESDQSTQAAYEASDVLGAVIYSTTETCPELNFSHVLSAVQINVNSTKEVSSVVVNALTSVDYSVASLSFAASGSAVAVTPLSLGDDSYQAVVAPQTIAAGTAFIEVTVGGTVASWYITDAIELASGYKYVCNVTVTDNDVVFSGEIAPWGDGGEIDVTVGEIEMPFSGEGTASSPYLITSASELTALSEWVAAENSFAGKYFELTTDIDLGGTEDNQWTPIGNNSSRFEGIFDGDDHLISGLYINSSDDYVGLFGYTSEAHIKNLGVSGTVYANKYVGALVGRNYFSTISNCYNAATVTGVDMFVGGLTGYNYAGLIENCYNAGDVSGSANFVGGVAGYNFASSTSNVISTVNGCYNTGTISSTANYVGGVLSSNANYAFTNNCYNGGKVSGVSYVGGVLGYNYSANTISNCYNVGGVSGTTTTYIGSVLGFNFNSATVGIITNCYWLTGTTVSTSSNGTEMSESELKDAGMPALLNGEQTDGPWVSDSNEINSGYPVLSWQ